MACRVTCPITCVIYWLYCVEFDREIAGLVLNLSCKLKVYQSLKHMDISNHMYGYRFLLGISVLTHWGRVMHICNSKLTIIWSDNGWLARNHYLNKCWNIVNSNLRNKLQWNLKQNWYIFVHENACENDVWKMAANLSRHQCVKMLSYPKEEFPLKDNMVSWLFYNGNPYTWKDINSSYYCYIGRGTSNSRFISHNGFWLNFLVIIDPFVDEYEALGALPLDFMGEISSSYWSIYRWILGTRCSHIIDFMVQISCCYDLFADGYCSLGAVTIWILWLTSVS